MRFLSNLQPHFSGQARYLVTRACRTIAQTMQGWCPAVGKMQSSSAIPGQLGFRKLSQVFERQAGDLFPSDGYFKQ